MFKKITNVIKSNLAVNPIKLSKSVAGNIAKETSSVLGKVGKEVDETLLKKMKGNIRHFDNISKNKTKGKALSNLYKANQNRHKINLNTDKLTNTQKLKANADTTGKLAKEYFWNDPSKRVARIGTAVGGYVGVNAGLRKLSGGSLTQNNNGENDIAGIPFL